MENKILIYKFWMGDKQKKEELLNEIYLFNKNSKLFTIKLGPTRHEHKSLLEKYPSYKKFVENEEYASASDIYRFYVLSKDINCIYMDATMEFEEQKLYRLYKKCESEKRNCFVFESFRIVWSGFIINISLCPLFEQCLADANSHKFIASSITLSKMLIKNDLIENYRNVDKDKIKQLDISFLCINEPIDTVKIHPLESRRKKKRLNLWTNKKKRFYKTNLRDLIFLNLPNHIQKIIFRLVK